MTFRREYYAPESTVQVLINNTWVFVEYVEPSADPHCHVVYLVDEDITLHVHEHVVRPASVWPS